MSFRTLEPESRGGKIGKSLVSINNCWQEFHNVAHLWAAHMVWRTDKSEEEAVAMLSQENIPEFIGISEWFRKFGEGCYPRNSKPQPILEPSIMWKPQPEYHVLDITPEKINFSDKLKDILKTMT